MKKILGIFALALVLTSCGSGSSEKPADAVAPADSTAVAPADSTAQAPAAEEAHEEPAKEVK